LLEGCSLGKESDRFGEGEDHLALVTRLENAPGYVIRDNFCLLCVWILDNVAVVDGFDADIMRIFDRGMRDQDWTDGRGWVHTYIL
jgi:hypothetical protein